MTMCHYLFYSSVLPQSSVGVFALGPRPSPKDRSLLSLAVSAEEASIVSATASLTYLDSALLGLLHRSSRNGDV